jgi:predicted O-methyltransferase YrrM
LRRRSEPFTSRRATGAQRAGPGDFYGGAVLGAETIAARALEPGHIAALTDEARGRDADAYVEYVAQFVETGQARTPQWRYADIVTVLGAAAELLQPATYLEIGVRRGRSLAVVVSRSPACDVIGVDFWNEGYAGIDNPGPEHVQRLASEAGHTGVLELISGDSHAVLPELFASRRELSFDLVTVDGDHSKRGATQDLKDVLPRVRIGGALVFDDISHPAHPYLFGVWRDVVACDRRFSTWEFDDVGYGVAVALRRW